MALYAGLSPQEALQRWYEIRQKPAELLTPEERADVQQNMVGLSQENPEAFRLVASGTAPQKNAEGKNQRQVFNQQTGQWDTQDVHGYWSHPESWLQLAAAGSVGAPILAGAISGAGGAAGAAGSAAGGTGAGTGAAGTGLSLGAVEGGAYGLPASSAAMLPTGGAMTAGTGAATGGSILGKVMSSPYMKNAMGMGQSISAASSAAGNTRRADTDTNVGAQQAFNSELLARAAAEQSQRDKALRDVYAAGYFRDQPRSPYNPAPVHGVSQNYLAALGNLEGQGMQRLQQGPQYGTNQMPQLNPYATKAGVGEKIGNYAGPILSTIGAMYGQTPYGQQPYRYPSAPGGDLGHNPPGWPYVMS